MSTNFHGGTSWLGPERPLSPAEPRHWTCRGCGSKRHWSTPVAFTCDWCVREHGPCCGSFVCQHCQREYCMSCAKRLEMFSEPNCCHQEECLHDEVARLRGLM